MFIPRSNYLKYYCNSEFNCVNKKNCSQQNFTPTPSHLNEYFSIIKWIKLILVCL